MSFPTLFLLLASLMTCGVRVQSQAAQPFAIMGSTAVFPFAAAIAERMALLDPDFQPIVEANGTGAGLKIFCQNDARPVAVAMASRSIQPEEAARCLKEVSQLSGQADHPSGRPLAPAIHEIKIGYDGIVLVTSLESLKFSLTMDQLFKGMAKWVPEGGRLVRNPNKTWHDVDPALPRIGIQVFGPPAHSGTRDSFVLLTIRRGCRIARLRGELSEQHMQACHRLREDEAYVAVGASENVIVQKVMNHPMALGILSYCFLEKNRSRLRALSIDGIAPNATTISSQKYALARPLFLYLKPKTFQEWPQALEFVQTFLKNETSPESRSSFLSRKGLVPLVGPEKDKQKQKLEAFYHQTRQEYSEGRVDE